MSILDPKIWAVLSVAPSTYIFVAVLGALWGSFGNVCIYRMPPSEEHPTGRSVVAPGSHCFSCGANVRWFDNVPLLSYLWLRGACRDCHTRFSPRYLLVEGAAALLFVAAYHYVVVVGHAADTPGEQLLRFGIVAAFLWTLLVITFIDLDHQLILDKITYPAIPIFYGLGMLLPGASWRQGLIGMALGYGLVRAISDGYWLVTRREGMGYGDGKLLAIIGALYGWQAVLVSLFLGSMIGTVISIPLLLVFSGKSSRKCSASLEDASEDLGSDRGPDPDSEQQEVGIAQVAVPFGPFIAAAAVVYVFVEGFVLLEFTSFW